MDPASIIGLGSDVGRLDRTHRLQSSVRGSLDGGSGSLPRPLTSFIGRERELAEAMRLLAGSRLLTLTGPGGSGSRLFIRLAALGGEQPAV